MSKKPLHIDPATYKSSHNPALIAESLKATFLNKKIGIYTSTIQITGTCCDISGGIFCLKDATLKILSADDFESLVDKKVSFIMVEKQGKMLTLEE